MKFKSIFVSLLGLLLLTGMTSCGSKVPDGMPKTFPCSVKVTKEGTPLVEATVQFVPANNSATNLNISGITDTMGVAQLATSIGTYSAAGAPEGEFIVLVKKDVELEHEKSLEELEKMEYGARMEYMKEYAAKKAALPRVVPDLLGRVSGSPLKVSVTSAGGELLNVEVNDYE
ncbi:MAG: hypothetical protein Q4C95_03620 [Planctomycetia bacterium]|nr:hypothetical protein [Planctomycetia bacterium]